MRRINIALVDDDETFLHMTQGQVEVCLDAMEVRHEISLFTDPQRFLESFREHCFDIVLLDIFFPDQNGMEVAKTIRSRNEKCQIVFLTVSSDYAIHGYGVKAANYLVKPLRAETLEPVLRDCLGRLKKEETQFVTVKDGPEVLLFDAGDIVYIELKGRYVNVYGEKGPLVVRFGKLADIVPVLPPAFVRIHQSFFVNITRVVSMKNYRMHIDTGIVLPVSRPYRSEAGRAFFGAVKSEL